NRTKFFDFIIPVIPVVNSSNSSEILRKKFDNDLFSDNFINDISLYIDDMRLLINICNEFTLYKEKLGNINFNFERLFSYIVYKNKYPTDFTDLQLGKGIVYNVFAKKKKVIKEHILDINNKIDNIEKSIDKIEKEHLDSLKDLRAVYLGEILEIGQRINYIRINGNRYFLRDILNDKKKFEEVKESNEFIVNYVENTSLNAKKSFREIEEALGNDLSYEEREEIINKNKNKMKDELHLEIERLNREKAEIKSMSLKSIIQKVGEEKVFDENIKEKELITFLLRNGYIDEMYHSFTSYFYPGSLTYEDMKFMFSVRNKGPLDFDHSLSNIKEILNRLHIEDFKSKEVFNYDLVDYIIDNISKYRTFYDNIISQLCDESKKSIKFIDGYKIVSENNVFFLRSIYNKWNSLWEYIEVKSDFSINKKDDYLLDVIHFASIEEITLLDKSSYLSKYISNNERFIKLINIDKIQKAKEVINSLNIKFKILEIPIKNNELFTFIYENNYYEINEDMIKIIIQTIGKNNKFKVSMLEKANYTTILKMDCINLIRYIKTNINEYLKNVLLKIETNIEESEDTIIRLLKNEVVLKENKIKIIEKQKEKITDIKKVDKQLWTDLFINMKASPKWTNLIYYFQERDKTIDEYLVDFINDETNYHQLSKYIIEVTDTINEDDIYDFTKDLLECSKISEDAFEFIKKSIPGKYVDLDIENISIKRLNNIVEYDLLGLTTNSFNLIKKRCNLQIELIENNIDDFLEEPSNYQIDKLDVEKILNSARITKEQKVLFINKLNDDLIDESDELIKLMYSILLDEELNIEVSINILDKLTRYLSYYNELLELLSYQVKYMNDTQITSILENLEKPYSDIAKKGNRPKIPNDPANKVFADALDKINYISSISVGDDIIRINTWKKER
ncbi:MAG: hypothetical protein ACOCRK_08650, partial [bacterium]